MKNNDNNAPLKTRFDKQARGSKAKRKSDGQDVSLPGDPYLSEPNLASKLLDAAIQGDLSMARKLMARGADPNAMNSMAMVAAVSFENMPMLTAMLQTGKADSHDERPLRTAVWEGRAQMAYKLIEYGANLKRLRKIIADTGTDRERENLEKFRIQYGARLKAMREKRRRQRLQKKQPCPVF